PDTRYTQGGMAVCKISLATTSVRKDRDDNNIEKTEWHRVTFFGKLAEIADEYLRKGSQVYIEGRITYSEVDGDDGTKKYFTDIIADQMQMLGGRGDGGGERRESGRSGGGERRESGGRGGDRSDPPARRAPPSSSGSSRSAPRQ